MSLATARVGRRVDIPTSTVSLLANAAYFEVVANTPHAMQERYAVSSTTSGEGRIVLPTDFLEPIALAINWLPWSASSTSTAARIRSTRTLKPRSVVEFASLASLPGGTPETYTFFSNWFELYPSPDSGYSMQMWYRSMVTDMTSLTDIPSISTTWRPAVLHKLTQLLHEHLGNPQGAALAERAYVAFASQQKTEEARRQSSQDRYGVSVIW